MYLCSSTSQYVVAQGMHEILLSSLFCSAWYVSVAIDRSCLNRVVVVARPTLPRASTLFTSANYFTRPLAAQTATISNNIDPLPPRTVYLASLRESFLLTSLFNRFLQIE
jgi:hypothetical protein